MTLLDINNVRDMSNQLGIIGKRIVYVARRVSGPRLVMKGGRHRGLEGVLYDAEAYTYLRSSQASK